MNSLATETGPPPAGTTSDSLDLKIENLLRDWHHSPDLLFSIHPIDGSFLIWYFIHLYVIHYMNIFEHVIVIIKLIDIC